MKAVYVEAKENLEKVKEYKITIYKNKENKDYICELTGYTKAYSVGATITFVLSEIIGILQKEIKYR